MSAPVPQPAASRPARERACPGCGGKDVQVFFEQPAVPVTSNQMFTTRQQAVDCPRGDMRLGFCHSCGLITNVAFQGSGVLDEYESSQAASAQFRRYAGDLSRAWVERHGLRGRAVLEIGCGRGEFLTTFCRESGGRGVGVDPALTAGPGEEPPADATLEWVPATFQGAHLEDDIAAVICRHTLEHVPDPAAFLRDIRDAVGTRDVTLLLEVPDVAPILRATAFWDIYYEHCNYFSEGALSRLLGRVGFHVRNVERTYGGQYLVVDAHPGEPAPVLDDRRALWHAALAFREEHERTVAGLRQAFQDLAARGQRVVFWGGGSKATAYLVALGEDLVDCVVDINARKQGTFIAGTGQPVVAPEHLRALRPDVVVMMNPVYRQEIADSLESLDVSVRLVDPEGV